MDSVAQLADSLSRCCNARDGRSLAGLFQTHFASVSRQDSHTVTIGKAMESVQSTEIVRMVGAVSLPLVSGSSNKLASWKQFVIAYCEFSKAVVSELRQHSSGQSIQSAKRISNVVEATQFDKAVRQRFDCLAKLLDGYRDPFDHWQNQLLQDLVNNYVELATEVDISKRWQQLPATKTGDSVQKLTSFLSSFSADPRPWPETRKVALLFVINKAFRIFFKLGKLHLIQAFYDMTAKNEIDWSPFPTAERVTFFFFLGKWLLLEGRFQVAESYLSEAFGLCASSFQHQKQTILIYLIVVRMVLGKSLPQTPLLQKYALDAVFGPLLLHYPHGYIGRFLALLDERQAYFRKRGVYLLFRERVQMVLWRNLLKKCYLAFPRRIAAEAEFQSGGARSANSVPLPMAALVFAAHASGYSNFYIDDAEYLVANLIKQSWVRAYIYHEARTVVIPLKTPFPQTLTLKKAQPTVWRLQRNNRPEHWTEVGSVQPLKHSQLSDLKPQFNVYATPFTPHFSM